MIAEWLHYATRLFHLIAGIMWIGTSFYFVWLDYAFEPVVDESGASKGAAGVEGETYMVHGGFFYRVEKQKPTVMPKVLHWFKYEALLTWVSGMFLLCLVYWMGGGLALLGKATFPLTQWTAIGISIGSLVVAWILYDLLWTFVGRKAPAAAVAVSLALLVVAIWGYCHVFPGRAAYIHVGAMLGTVMIANVWMRILPNQRRMIAASLAGQEPDWARGAAAKQRSLHNSYMTIPVLVTMVSNHFSFVFDSTRNWQLLLLLVVVGAGVRHVMITMERKQTSWAALGVAVVGLGAAVFLTIPHPPPPDHTPPVAFADVSAIMARRCRTCHSSTPTDDVFHAPPNGVTFDSPDNVAALAPRIRLRVVEAQSMPFANKTQMTDGEREIMRRWIDQGAHL